MEICSSTMKLGLSSVSTLCSNVASSLRFDFTKTGIYTNFIRNMSSTCANPVVAVVAKLEPTFTSELRERCPAARVVRIEPAKITKEDLQDVEILITDPPIIYAWLDYLPKLKWLYSTYAGVNHIFERLQSNKPPPFVVTKLGGIYGPMMAEYVVGHIIARERQFMLSWKHQQTKTWPDWSEISYRLLSDITIGIIGFGDIGQEVAKYCKALKMKVHSIHRSVPHPELSFVDETFSIEDLPECLSQCDYLCNLLPSTPDTIGLLDGDVLKPCKEKKTVFINIGRGDIITNASILNALDNQWLGGAILDVFEHEPLPSDSSLWTHPEVTITPHISGLVTSHSQVLDLFLENFKLYQTGKPMKFVVDWKKGY